MKPISLPPTIAVRLVPGTVDRDRAARWLRDLIEQARAAKANRKDQDQAAA